jgi:hypothetical protein
LKIFSGRLGGDFLDVHAPGGAHHEHRALGLAIGDEADVGFGRDLRRRHNQDLPTTRSLIFMPEDPTRVLIGFRGVLGELDAARFATATGVHLRLHDDGSTHSARNRLRLRGRGGDVAVRNRNARGLEHGASLVFVEIHRDPIVVKSPGK